MQPVLLVELGINRSKSGGLLSEGVLHGPAKGHEASTTCRRRHRRRVTNDIPRKVEGLKVVRLVHLFWAENMHQKS